MADISPDSRRNRADISAIEPCFAACWLISALRAERGGARERQLDGGGEGGQLPRGRAGREPAGAGPALRRLARDPARDSAEQDSATPEPANARSAVRGTPAASAIPVRRA